MRRDIFSDEHELFRSQFKRFAQAEIVPKIAGWDEKGMSDRATWKRMGEEGFLGANAPEAYGGAGADFLYDAIVMEELAYVRAHGLMMSLHSDICLPYITEFGTEAQKQKYLPKLATGEWIASYSLSESSSARRKSISPNCRNMIKKRRRYGSVQGCPGSICEPLLVAFGT
jgi:acyl-CoA dehydrogenase